jgi:glucan 1,3-beta-glucosidase
MPVTYADVWEFGCATATCSGGRLVTVISALLRISISLRRRAPVDAIRSRVAASFPGGDILIGEVGCRAREGCGRGLPSPANQALVRRRDGAGARQELPGQPHRSLDQP